MLKLQHGANLAFWSNFSMKVSLFGTSCVREWGHTHVWRQLMPSTVLCVGEATLNTPLCTQLEKVELHQNYPRERSIWLTQARWKNSSKPLEKKGNAHVIQNYKKIWVYRPYINNRKMPHYFWCKEFERIGFHHHVGIWASDSNHWTVPPDCGYSAGALRSMQLSVKHYGMLCS